MTLLLRAANWMRWYAWRVDWRAAWFHLGRAVMLTAASQAVAGLGREMKDRGKIYAREAFLALNGDLDR